MKYVYDRSFTFKLNEDTWEAYLLTDEEATDLDEQLHDTKTGFRALTASDTKCLFLVEDSVTKNIITHELFHIYVYYLYLDSADVTLRQFEEILAEFFEETLDKFIKKRNSLYNRFKKLDDSGSKK